MTQTLTLKPEPTTTPTNNQKLRATMRVHGISRMHTAKILNVSPHAVDKWLLPNTAKGYRRVTDSTYQCLRLAIYAYQTTPLSLLRSQSLVDTGVLDQCKIERLRAD